MNEDTARGIKSKLDKGIAPILAPPGYRNCLEKRQGERNIEPVPDQFTLSETYSRYISYGITPFNNYGLRQKNWV